MLVLSRQRSESIMIGDNIVIMVVDIRGDKVRLGVNAPNDIPVHRREVYDAIRREKGYIPNTRVVSSPIGKGNRMPQVQQATFACNDEVDDATLRELMELGCSVCVDPNNPTCVTVSGTTDAMRAGREHLENSGAVFQAPPKANPGDEEPIARRSSVRSRSGATPRKLKDNTADDSVASDAEDDASNEDAGVEDDSEE